MSARLSSSSRPLPSRGKVSWNQLGVGGALALLQGMRMNFVVRDELELRMAVSTLGQPFEVLKTHMAANREDNFRAAIRKTWATWRCDWFLPRLDTVGRCVFPKSEHFLITQRHGWKQDPREPSYCLRRGRQSGARCKHFQGMRLSPALLGVWSGDWCRHMLSWA